jgi:hypothetical protein
VPGFLPERFSDAAPLVEASIVIELAEGLVLRFANQLPQGTRRLQRAYTNEPFFKQVTRLARAMASDPERCAKIAAARRGKPRSPHVVEAVRRAHLGMRHTDAARKKMSVAHQRRGTRPPKAGRPWTSKEDALLGKLPTDRLWPERVALRPQFICVGAYWDCPMVVGERLISR